MNENSPHNWFERADKALPAGGFGNFDNAVMISHGTGAYVHTTDGRKFIDYLIGSGPMVLGHGHPEVLEAVHDQLDKGMTFFANSTAGVELAEEINEALPSAEQLRYVSTGGEADMYAMRLARAYTGRSKIVKFEGGYHGMSAEAQMSLAPTREVNFPQPIPDSAGIPKSVEQDMLIAPFNDMDFITSLFAEYGDEIAGIIVEPLQRIIPPEEGFLACLRQLCDAHGAVLIFDEVVTAFRFHYNGAQTLYGVTPDLTTLGKIIGGGFPLAAIAGKKEIMDLFDKKAAGQDPHGQDRWLMQTGTLSGNPVASVAGLKTLEILKRPESLTRLNQMGKRLWQRIDEALSSQGVPHQMVGHPTLFDVVFSDHPVRNYRDTKSANGAHSALFNRILREQGILKSPAKLYPQLALSEADLIQTEEAIEMAAKAVGQHINS